uniref:Protein FAM228B n=1 Tax=Ciona savignyi TaxID=51511 RepID=H2ZKQ2_CIOSA
MERSKLNQNSLGSIKFYSTDATEFDRQIEKDKEYKCGIKSSTRIRSGKHISQTSSNTSSSENSQHIRNWINQKSLHQLQDRHSTENHDTKQMYSIVLDNEENFVKGIDEFLKDNDLLNLRKKELLYKRWNERVYVPVRKRVEQAIESGFQPLDGARRKEHRNYLNYTNKKGVVFLDTISQEDYNPLALYGDRSSTSLKIRTARLKDPLLASERQRDDEDKMILQCETGLIFPDHRIRSRRLPPPPLVPLGRHGTSCSTWLAMPLRDVESPLRMRSRHRMKKSVNKSIIEFDGWNGHKYGQEVVDSELGIQRKRRFDIPSTMPSPAILAMAEKNTQTSKDPEKPAKVHFLMPNENEKNSLMHVHQITA